MDEGLKVVWQAALTALLGMMAWFFKSSHADLRRIEKELATHKTEVAKDYATKSDLTESTRQLLSRFDRLEEKIDRLVERSK